MYEDGTLAFSSKDKEIEGKTLKKSYEDIKGKTYTGTWDSPNTPWYSDKETINITIVKFVDEIVPESTAHWFSQCTNLKQIENIKNLNTSKVTDMSYMFSYCTSLESLDVSNFKTSNVKSMKGMFNECRKLTSLNVSNFDTSNVTDMFAMFGVCRKLTSLNVSNFDTSNVTDMAWMFGDPDPNGKMSLTEIIGLENFDTRKVKDMTDMFCRCSSLKSIIVGEYWVMAPKTTDMFWDCPAQIIKKETN